VDTIGQNVLLLVMLQNVADFSNPIYIAWRDVLHGILYKSYYRVSCSLMQSEVDLLGVPI
jgi:hypothetical protein